MADEVRRIIEVEARGAETLAQLQQVVTDAQVAMLQLNAAVKDGTATEEDYQKGLVQLKTAQQQYNKEMRVQVKENQAAKGSYNDLVNQLTRLKEKWKQAEPNTEAYRDLMKQVNDVKKQLESMDHDIGNWQRNVGNYANSIADIAGLFGGTGRAAQGALGAINGMTNGLRVMSATPAIAVLGGLVVLLEKIGGAFKTSEAAANSLALAFAPLKAGGQLLTNIMQDLAKSIANAAEWLGRMAERLGLFTDKMKENQQITQEEIDLRKEQRRVTVENAQLELEAAQQRNIAADKANHTVKERIAALESAAAAEKKIMDNNLAIAQREYNLAKRRADLTENSIEDNDDLAQKEAQLYRVRAEYEAGQRRLISQTSAAIMELRSETKAAAEEVEDYTFKVTAGWEGRLTAAEKAAVEARKQAAADLKEIEKFFAEDSTTFLTQLQSDLDAMNAAFNDSIVENRRKEEADKKQRISDLLTYAKAVSAVMDDVAGAYQNTLKAEVAAGRMSEQEGERRFKNVKALQYAVTGINTAAAMVQALSDPVVPSYFVRAANAATALSAGIANAVKIKNATLGGSQTSSATGQGVQAATTINTAAPVLQETTPTTRLVADPRDEQRLNEMLKAQKVYILQSDIEAAGEARKVQLTESGF